MGSYVAYALDRHYLSQGRVFLTNEWIKLKLLDCGTILLCDKANSLSCEDKEGVDCCKFFLRAEENALSYEGKGRARERMKWEWE